MPAEVRFEVLGVRFDLNIEIYYGKKSGEIWVEDFFPPAKNVLKSIFGADFWGADFGESCGNFVSNFVFLVPKLHSAEGRR